MGFFESIKDIFRPEIRVNPNIVERERRNIIEDEASLNYLLNYVKLSKRTLEEEKKSNNFLNHPRASERRKHKKVIVKVLKGKDILASMRKLELEMKLQLFCRGCGMGTEFRKYEKGKFLVGEAVPIARGFYFAMQ